MRRPAEVGVGWGESNSSPIKLGHEGQTGVRGAQAANPGANGSLHEARHRLETASPCPSSEKEGQLEFAENLVGFSYPRLRPNNFLKSVRRILGYDHEMGPGHAARPLVSRGGHLPHGYRVRGLLGPGDRGRRFHRARATRCAGRIGGRKAILSIDRPGLLQGDRQPAPGLPGVSWRPTPSGATVVVLLMIVVPPRAPGGCGLPANESPGSTSWWGEVNGDLRPACRGRRSSTSTRRSRKEELLPLYGDQRT